MSFHRLLVSIAVDEKSDSQMFPNHLSNQGSGLCKYGPITAQPTQQGSCVSLWSPSPELTEGRDLVLYISVFLHWVLSGHVEVNQ